MEKTNYKPQKIQPKFRLIDDLSIRFAKNENLDQGAHAILLCPWPERIYAFKQIWSLLNPYAHQVAVDLPSFGHSEYKESLISPKAIREFIVRIADEFWIEQPNIAWPDIGTAASLSGAALHPERLRSVVVRSGGHHTH